jgi:hypothetical protein
MTATTDATPAARPARFRGFHREGPGRPWVAIPGAEGATAGECWAKVLRLRQGGDFLVTAEDPNKAPEAGRTGR